MADVNVFLLFVGLMINLQFATFFSYVGVSGRKAGFWPPFFEVILA
jgi:hypothetical protein